MSNQVICNSRNKCGEAYMCGGARPHNRDLNECGKCPFVSDSECVPAEQQKDDIELKIMDNLEFKKRSE